MTIDDNIRDEKLKYDTNKETPKISAYCQVKLINMNILQEKNITLQSK